LGLSGLSVIVQHCSDRNSPL